MFNCWEFLFSDLIFLRLSTGGSELKPAFFARATKNTVGSEPLVKTRKAENYRLFVKIFKLNLDFRSQYMHSRVLM